MQSRRLAKSKDPAEGAGMTSSGRLQEEQGVEAQKRDGQTGQPESSDEKVTADWCNDRDEVVVGVFVGVGVCVDCVR